MNRIRAQCPVRLVGSVTWCLPVESKAGLDSGPPPQAWDDPGTGLSSPVGIKNRSLLELEREAKLGLAFGPLCLSSFLMSTWG